MYREFGRCGRDHASTAAVRGGAARRHARARRWRRAKHGLEELAIALGTHARGGEAADQVPTQWSGRASISWKIVAAAVPPASAWPLSSRLWYAGRRRSSRAPGVAEDRRAPSGSSPGAHVGPAQSAGAAARRAAWPEQLWSSSTRGAALSAHRLTSLRPCGGCALRTMSGRCSGVAARGGPRGGRGSRPHSRSERLERLCRTVLGDYPSRMRRGPGWKNGVVGGAGRNFARAASCSSMAAVAAPRVALDATLAGPRLRSRDGSTLGSPRCVTADPWGCSARPRCTVLTLFRHALGRIGRRTGCE